MDKISSCLGVLRSIGFTEYQATVLMHLYALGTAKATDIVRSSGVPQAKIYFILQELADFRLIRLINTKPTTYAAIEPTEGLENYKEVIRGQRERDLALIDQAKQGSGRVLRELYGEGLRNRPEQEFLEIVRIGLPSESATRAIYRMAKREISVVSRAFEYLPCLGDDVAMAVDRGVLIRVLLLHRSLLRKEQRPLHRQVVQSLAILGVETRFSRGKLPMRFTLVDPDEDYVEGACVFAVEEKNMPLSIRRAVYSKNPSLSFALKQYFDFLWKASAPAKR